MLLLHQLLRLDAPLRLAALATLASFLLAAPIRAQTYSTCNPTLTTSCSPDPALGKALSIDFTSSSASTSSTFSTTGHPTYSSSGVSFTIAQSGDAPQLTSPWYIMFGSTSITMRAAPGVGIVSTSVLQSDDLDEIDWEWLGASSSSVQSNYFGKGQTTTYDRGATHAVSDSQDAWHTYGLVWTHESVTWSIDGVVVRVLTAEAAGDQYPQTPMQVKIGAWSAGDAANAAGTIAWAGGLTDYAAGPYTMLVSELVVQDYSTGTSYAYQGSSGDWTSIVAAGGTVYAGAGGEKVVSSGAGASAVVAASAGAASSVSTPGIGTWVATATSGGITATNTLDLPAGWTTNADGNAVPINAGPAASVPSGFLYFVACSLVAGLLLPLRV